MRSRLFTVAAVLAASGILVAGQQSGPSRGPAVRERLREAPTPGVLLPLRTAEDDRLFIDVTGLSAVLPDVWETDPASGGQYRRDELLVRFRSGTGAGLRGQARQAARTSRVARALPGTWELLRLDPNASLREAAMALTRSGSVEEVSLNYRLATRQFRPNDESYGLQWNFDAIGLPDAWEINPGARDDVIVAVVDSGLNIISDTFVFNSPVVGQIPVRFAAVPDLVTDARITRPYDFIYEDEYPVDLGGHGTHVAGTIAQLTDNGVGVAGIAYNVRLMPLKVISGGSFISWDDIFFPGNAGGSAAIVAEAIRYAADHGADVINLSLGIAAPVPIVRDAIAYAVGRGAFVAIAAGNDGESGNPTEYPAAYAPEIRGAMAVGAVNRSLRRAAYSGFQPYVEICAPGGETEGDFDFQQGITQIGYEEASTLSFLTLLQKLAALDAGFRPRFDRFELRPFEGTSMATPHVSGVAALLHSQGIRSPAAIESAITRFATPIAAGAEECGAGLIDSRRALRGLGLAR